MRRWARAEDEREGYRSALLDSGAKAARCQGGLPTALTNRTSGSVARPARQGEHHTRVYQLHVLCRTQPHLQRLSTRAQKSSVLYLEREDREDREHRDGRAHGAACEHRRREAVPNPWLATRDVHVGYMVRVSVCGVGVGVGMWYACGRECGCGKAVVAVLCWQVAGRVRDVPLASRPPDGHCWPC